MPATRRAATSDEVKDLRREAQALIVNGAALVGSTADYEQMTSFQESDEAVNVGEARRGRDHDRVTRPLVGASARQI